MNLQRLRTLAVCVLPLALLFGSAAEATAQQASISGRVTAQGSAEPVQEARVMVVGTTLFAITNAEGRYTIRNVPAGTAEVRVLRVGFAEQKKPVTLSGQDVTLDFTMSQIAVKLADVVTTATGEQARTELGNSVATIKADDKLKSAPIRNVSDLLTAAAPGVQALPSGLTGTSTRIRIRGVSSLSLSNDPIYVIDGIRLTAAGGGASSLSVGGSLVSRVNDIDPNSIESIEIVKGPSAATLYGTDAANGVVVITTKKGRAGGHRWNVHAEQGLINQWNEFPTAYSGWGHIVSNGNATTNCYLADQVAGRCTLDSLSHFNLFDDKETTPYGTGTRQNVGVSLSGGTDAIRYFASGEYENNVDPLKMPEFDRARYAANNQLVRPTSLRPNALQRTSLRLNLNATPNPKFDVALTSNFIQTDQRLPQTDNNTYGLFSHAYGGPGYKSTNPALSYTGTTPLYGYRAMTPGEIFQYDWHQGATRFIGSTQANYRPTSWLSGRATVGVDFTDQTDQNLCRRSNCVGSTTRLLGFANDNTVRFYNYSADLGATATFNPLEWLNSKTTVGTQYVNQQTLQNFAGSSTLPIGATSVSAGAVPVAGEATALSKTLGAYVEEQVGIRDRLFVTGAVRTDQNSAFGTNFQRVYYPKFSASYIISDEEWFPRMDWLNALRLRASHGSSGVQPGPNDALRYFAASTVSSDRADQAAVIASTLGNANLKPERATESEGGFEARMLDSRVNLDLTYYSKQTKDAIISRTIAPSAGSVVSRRENIGSIKNAGVEALIQAQVLQGNSLAWDVSLNGSTNSNKIVSMGIVPAQIGSNYRNQAGYPKFGWWERKYTYNDADKNGIITANEITVAADQTYLGGAVPQYEAVLTNGFDLFNKKLRLQALVDYKGGYKIENVTEEFRCTSRANCRALYDKNASLADQARAVAYRELTGNAKTTYGFIEDGSFIRFRELGLTYTPAESFAQRYLRARNASLSLSARNLGFLWNKYSGIDPEMNYGNGDFVSEFQTAPTPTVFTVRLNLGF